MSLHNRAAQFAPFAALSGYEEMVGETARLTDRRKGTDEENLQKLDQQIHALMEQAQDHPEITLVIFEPDEKKEGLREKLVEVLNDCAETCRKQD